MPSPLRLAATALIALGGAVTGLAASAQMSQGATPPTASTPMPGSDSADQPAAVPTKKSKSDSSKSKSKDTAADSSTTSASGGSASAETGKAANTNATGAALAAGMTVKDNTGASIGTIASTAPNASGGSMVTIKMGADSFQVPAANLAVNGGAATINLTKAQIQSELHPAAAAPK